MEFLRSLILLFAGIPSDEATAKPDVGAATTLAISLFDS